MTRPRDARNGVFGKTSRTARRRAFCSSSVRAIAPQPPNSPEAAPPSIRTARRSAPPVRGKGRARARAHRHLRLAVPPLAGPVLSARPAPAPLARALRRLLRHGRGQQRLLPPPRDPHLRRVGIANPG